MRALWLSPMAGALLGASAVHDTRADESLPPAVQPDVSIECPRCLPGHWSSEPFRPFVSLTMVAGYLYLKPRLSLGYGRPFSQWAGIDVTPLVTPAYVGGFSGLHLQISWFELRAGARVVHAFEHQFLPLQPSYNLVDLAEFTGRPANYLDLEAEISAAIPAGPGDILVLGTASSIQFVPAGDEVYDENLRVIVRPPPVYRARLGYGLKVLPERNAMVGPVAEVLEIPGRSAQVYRAGLVATFDIDDHLQAVGVLVVPVVSPDSLGLAGADYTELGIRYRWATGHADAPREVIPGESSAFSLPR
jgi:hypothetical protein